MTEDDVRQMLRERCEASKQVVVAAEAGVSPQLINMMLKGKPVSGRVRDLLGVPRNGRGPKRKVDLCCDRCHDEA